VEDGEVDLEVKTGGPGAVGALGVGVGVGGFGVSMPSDIVDSGR